MADKATTEQPKTQRFVIDRYIYHTPGKRPHLIGTEQDFVPEEIEHLVQAGFLHRVGSEPAPSAVGIGQQAVTQPPTSTTIAPPPPAAPLNYETKAPAAA